MQLRKSAHTDAVHGPLGVTRLKAKTLRVKANSNLKRTTKMTLGNENVIPQQTTLTEKESKPLTKAGLVRRDASWVRQSQLYELIKSQAFKCALTGRELRPDNAALDHIIPFADDGKHVIENVHWVHEAVNRAKGTLPLDEFITICKEVVAHLYPAIYEQHQPSIRSGDKCEKCQSGHYGVLNSIVTGDVRIRYLGCTECQYRPKHNIQAVPLKFAPPQHERDYKRGDKSTK
jgi:5-methylcytosine-specific restriction endonuclease McrA